MKKVQVVPGDIAQIQTDAIITAVNSGGMWFGGIDGVIQRAAGSFFHIQVQRQLPLEHGATVVTKSNGQKHGGAFTNVVFVIDDLQGPLSEIIFNGLKAASEAGFKDVLLPTIRMGVMLGVVEKTKQEAVTEMIAGVADFFRQHSRTSIETVTFVVYMDPDTEDLLRTAISVTQIPQCS